MNDGIKEYKKYLADHFPGLKIQKPLFFNGKFGLRFDLQVGETDTEDYFKEVISRSKSLFEMAFASTDNVFLLYMKPKWKKRKIRFGNYCFKQIGQLNKDEINYSIVNNVYEKGDAYNLAVLKLTTERINYLNILTAIANTDFPPRQPRFRVVGGEEIYFINTSKNLIFHMYDDRGLDIISPKVEILKPIYSKYKDWILDVNRTQIEKMFQ